MAGILHLDFLFGGLGGRLRRQHQRVLLDGRPDPLVLVGRFRYQQRDLVAESLQRIGQ